MRKCIFHIAFVDFLWLEKMLIHRPNHFCPLLCGGRTVVAVVVVVCDSMAAFCCASFCFFNSVNSSYHCSMFAFKLLCALFHFCNNCRMEMEIVPIQIIPKSILSPYLQCREVRCEFLDHKGPCSGRNRNRRLIVRYRLNDRANESGLYQQQMHNKKTKAFKSNCLICFQKNMEIFHLIGGASCTIVIAQRSILQEQRYQPVLANHEIHGANHMSMVLDEFPVVQCLVRGQQTATVVS